MSFVESCELCKQAMIFAKSLKLYQSRNTCCIEQPSHLFTLIEAPQKPAPFSSTHCAGIGDDARNLFTAASAAALETAASYADISLMNPVLVQCKATSVPFYAILHHHQPGGGILIDLEPIQASDPFVTGAGALQSHRLAAKSGSRIQSLPLGNQQLLFQAMAEEVGTPSC